MLTAQQIWHSTVSQVHGWSWFKKTYAVIFAAGFLISSFLFLTPPGEDIREWIAQTVITTQHREWAWMVVGGDKRDRMVDQLHLDRERWGLERQNFAMINLSKKKTAAELIKVEDISAPLWKGKKMYVYDPRSIRVVVPGKAGEGERISSMVERTGAVAGINGGGFIDPDGLGNGFAPIGFIISGGEILYTDQDGSIAQHVVGFTKEGILVVGKYTIDQLVEMGISEAVMFYPRVIANGKGLITSGDGGWGRGPRTAIGQKEDGTVIIMVIDGRQSHSVGATLKELQDLMLAEGVVNAGFLDGGASSELVTEEGLLTKPSSRYGERRLPSALLVFGEPNAYIANNPWDGVTRIDPGGAYDHPEYLKEQEELKAKGKLKPSPAQTPDAGPAGSPAASASPGAPAGSPAAAETSSGSHSSSPAVSTAPDASGEPKNSRQPAASGTPAAGSGAGSAVSGSAAGGGAGSASPGPGSGASGGSSGSAAGNGPVNPTTGSGASGGSVSPSAGSGPSSLTPGGGKSSGPSSPATGSRISPAPGGGANSGGTAPSGTAQPSSSAKSAVNPSLAPDGSTAGLSK
ncbi:MAG: hypothetical protein K0R57_3579 [Paenibacillaceae bacterium]|nr:hypothetical protein [Paenibacillaceae bacterium]